MRPKLPDNIGLFSELEADPDRISSQVLDTDAAELQSLGDYQKDQEERQFLRAVVKGLADLEEGREVSLAETRARVSR